MTTRAPGRPASYSIALTLLVAVYVLGVLRLQTHWWFEDDPYQLAIASRHQPWEFFVSRASLSRGLVGLLFTPLQNLTYWIDQRIAPQSAGFAYAHTAASLWLGALMLFVVLRYWIRESTAGLVVVLLLLLPSTIVCAEFVSVRNYLDGFVLSLVAVWLAQHAVEASGLLGLGLAVTAVGFFLLGSLAKELYVTTPFALMMGMFAWRRRWAAVALLSAGGVIYVGYYRWMMGSLTSAFTIPTLSAREYPAFLGRYPYVFAGGPWGWLLAALWLGAIGIGVWRRQIVARELAFAGGLVLIAMASMHPAAGALDQAYATRGTWYRTAFVSNVVILCLGTWLVTNLSAGWRRAVAACAVIALGCGAWFTVRTWDGLNARYRLEGQFYLSNPDKLLYSELPAWWFMVGLDDLYRVPARHYLLAAKPKQPGDDGLLETFGTVWRYSPSGEGRFDPAPELYQRLSGR